jgi:hypothetical protein
MFLLLAQLVLKWCLKSPLMTLSTPLSFWHEGCIGCTKFREISGHWVSHRHTSVALSSFSRKDSLSQSSSEYQWPKRRGSPLQVGASLRVIMSPLFGDRFTGTDFHISGLMVFTLKVAKIWRDPIDRIDRIDDRFIHAWSCGKIWFSGLMAACWITHHV